MAFVLVLQLLLLLAPVSTVLATVLSVTLATSCCGVGGGGSGKIGGECVSCPPVSQMDDVEVADFDLHVGAAWSPLHTLHV